MAAAFLSALALAGAGFAAYVVQSDRIGEHIDSAVSTEIAEFARLQRAGVDPATGRPFASAQRLMTAALQGNLPQPNEALIAYWDGRPQLGQGSGSRQLSQDAAFNRYVARVADRGGSATLDTPLGPTVVAVQAVHDPVHPGAYVVAHFVDAERAGLRDVMTTYALVALIALVLVTIGAWVVASRLLRPVRHLRETAQEISETDLTRRIAVEGNDDLTELAETFNAMLDRLETSFAQNRRFLDDAGHELRTPITIVRGHLEVLDPANRADVDATRELVLDEVDRMTRMVDDLVVLSKADQPDFVRLQPTDVGVLTDDVLDKVRALGDRQWRLDARAAGLAHVDPQRITQALVQLAKNAIAHTEPHDQIALGSRIGPGAVQWWVRDTGSGVQPEDAERIFERFQRGDGGRGSDGSGLGLSIVTAIMQAHDGQVRLDSEPGAGSTFTLVAPLGGVR